MNYPQILTEVNVCERFLPPAVKKSSRYLYLEMISAACSYLLEKDYTVKQRKIDETRKESFEGLEFG
jgi:hypothetical protein